MPSRTALIAGATGLVGSHALDLLLARPEYDKVIALVRRPLDRKNDKLDVGVVDFDHLEDSAQGLLADDVYVCLGTTIKVAGSQEKFRKVDHDYAVSVAEVAKKRGATRLALVSSVGASASASSFYLRVKGETEKDLGALGYATFTIARPSFLVGDRKEHRPGEAAGIAVARALSFTLLGGLRVYKPIEARAVAAALVRATLDGEPGTRVLSFAELTALSA